MKEQKKNKGSVLVVEFAYNAQNAQFGHVMQFFFISMKTFFKKFTYRETVDVRRHS